MYLKMQQKPPGPALLITIYLKTIPLIPAMAIKRSIHPDLLTAYRVEDPTTEQLDEEEQTALMNFNQVLVRET